MPVWEGWAMEISVFFHSHIVILLLQGGLLDPEVDNIVFFASRAQVVENILLVRLKAFLSVQIFIAQQRITSAER
jgi:hypothetical protein